MVSRPTVCIGERAWHRSLRDWVTNSLVLVSGAAVAHGAVTLGSIAGLVECVVGHAGSLRR